MNWRRDFLSTLAATLIGAVVGGLGGAYLGVTIGADRDDARSDREFIRTQRAALYGEYLAAVDEAQALMAPARLDIEPDGTLILDSAALDAEQTAALKEESNRVATLQGRIYVTGGDEVAEAAQNLTAQVTSMSLFTEYVARCKIDMNFDDGCAGVEDGRLSGHEEDPFTAVCRLVDG
jgi:hypothetical protein